MNRFHWLENHFDGEQQIIFYQNDFAKWPIKSFSVHWKIICYRNEKRLRPSLWILSICRWLHFHWRRKSFSTQPENDFLADESIDCKIICQCNAKWFSSRWFHFHLHKSHFLADDYIHDPAKMIFQPMIPLPFAYFHLLAPGQRKSFDFDLQLNMK